jgi:putative ATP-binding cassette transporter
VLSFFLKNSRALTVIALAAGLLSGGATTGLLALVHVALKGTSSQNQLHLIAAFCALCICMPCSRVLSQTVLMRLGHRATLLLRVKLGEQILKASLRNLERLGIHSLNATMTEDITAIANGLVTGPAVLLQGAVLLACLAYMGWLSLPGMLFVAVFLLVGFVSVQFLVRPGRKYLEMARRKEDDLMMDLRGLTEGSKQLKLNDRQRKVFLEDVYEPDARMYHRYGFKGGSILLAALGWANVLFFILIGLLIWVGPKFGIVRPTDVGAFVLALLYMMVPLDTIGSLTPAIMGATVARHKIESLGLSFVDPSEPADEPCSAPAWGLLQIREVTHTYYTDRNEHFTLGPLNLTIEPQEIIFVTGGNGSGKTTLLKLIVGLYEPEGGMIFLDGSPISRDMLASYRQNFSVVFSDFFLFNRLLSDPSAAVDSLASSYLVRLQLDRKLKIENGVLSTTELSQGQRKRLALLGAYMEDRPVYVFDEWAADQDPIFKEVFYNELLPELRARGKTVIVATHDEKYFDVADRHIKLADGQLVDVDAEPVSAAMHTLWR